MSTIHRYEPVLDVVDAEDAVRLTQEIVRIPSVVGDEGYLADALAERMRGMGFDRVAQQEVLPGRTNVIGVGRLGASRPDAGAHRATSTPSRCATAGTATPTRAASRTGGCTATP